MSTYPKTTYPKTLAIFPLDGVLLLPGGSLPLHIFEPRYRAMTEDLLRDGGMIGMVQPLRPEEVSDSGEEEAPALYAIGCAGKLQNWEQSSDGRYHILLRGVCRFRILEEIAMQQGYRRARVDFAEFAADPQDLEQDLDISQLLDALVEFTRIHNVDIDKRKLQGVPGVGILNRLAMTMRFEAVEKQALLEAKNIMERQSVLLSLIQMGIEMSASGAPREPAITH
jgi:Lon protease-like protein